MHSTSIFNILSASALFALTQAAPVTQGTKSTLAERSSYSKCKLPSGLYWDGECSVDPCGNWISWCPDYQYGTKIPVNGGNDPIPTNEKPKVADETPTMSGGAFYICAASGFRGTCSYDPCDGKASSWCNDYEYKTNTPKKSGTPVKRGLIYSQCTLPSGLRFDGFCSQDPCGAWVDWCVDYEFGTYTPKSTTDPAPDNKTTVILAPQTCAVSETRLEPNAGNTCKYGLALNFFVCQSNGFKGCCSSDPCAKQWCPDYKPGCYSA